MAFCGIMTAMALVSMILGHLLPVMLYTSVLLSGVCIAFVSEEIDLRYATSVYLAVSVLALLFLPDKEAAVVFITIFGYYPVFRNLISQSDKKILHNSKILFIIKLIYINICCILYFLITTYILGIPKENLSIGEVYLPGVFLVMGNLLCLMYDKALNNLILLYKYKFRKNIFRKW